MRGIMTCFNDRFTEIQSYNLLKLPIKESEIVKRSILIYGEDEPCIIYRTAIINTIGLELYEKVKNESLISNMYSVKNIDEITKGYIEFPKGCEYVTFN